MAHEMDFTNAELFKFGILANGVTVTASAQRYLAAATLDGEVTSADYASTSGIILVLDTDVWVNAPIVDHNANFVVRPSHTLDVRGDSLVVRSATAEISAQFWFPPLIHEQSNSQGEAYTSYGFTHTDRVRVSPVEGCSMTCKFCDLPYEFRYRTKRIEGLVDAARAALSDPVQPAAHILISGGTPRDEDSEYLIDSYEAILSAFPDTAVDIMMVPIDEVLPLERLAQLGLNELSLNIEIYNRDIARKLMRRKHDQGLDHYLNFLERAAEVFSGDRVRSMLMVGLEPIEDTLAGVDAIARRGCVPVLSPFRPDESTPLRGWRPPTADFMMEVYARAFAITQQHGVSLGPGCIPCTHNTLTLASTGHGDANHYHGHPQLC